MQESWFEQQNFIAEGAFGQVYRCVDLQTNQVFALKKFNTSQKTQSAFEEEVAGALLFNSTQSSRLIHMIGVQQNEQERAIVYELCEGGELYDYIANQEPMPRPIATAIARELALALRDLHTNDIVHADLKLDNILLTKEKQIKLGDPGFTCRAGGPTGVGIFTKTRGTHMYLDPDMVANRPFHGKAADVFALGIVFFAVFRGKFPWEEADPTKNRRFRKFYERNFAEFWAESAPQGQADYVSEEFKDLMQGMLSPNAYDRLSIEQVLDHPFFGEGESASLSVVKAELESRH